MADGDDLEEFLRMEEDGEQEDERDNSEEEVVAEDYLDRLKYDRTNKNDKAYMRYHARRALQVEKGKRTEDDISILMDLTENVKFFQGFKPENRVQLCQVCTWLDAKATEILFAQGSVGTTFYVILSGTVDVIIKDDETGEERKVKQLFAGESFGEIALLSDAPRKSTIQCFEDSSFLCIEKDDYKETAGKIAEEELKDRINFLKEIPFLMGSNPPVNFHQLAQIIAPKTFPRNKVIIRQGDEAESFFILKTGECKVVKKLQFAKKKTPGLATAATPMAAAANATTTATPRASATGPSPLRTTPRTAVTPRAAGAAVEPEEFKLLEIEALGPKSYFGEIGLIKNSKCTASVITSTPVEILVLSKTDFQNIKILPKQVVTRLEEGISKYRSDAELKEEYFKELKWQNYKTKLVSSILEDKQAKRNLGKNHL